MNPLFIFRWAHGLRAWTESLALTPYGPLALFGISLAEASFFPIPPDVLLLALAVAQPEKSLRFAGITTVASVLGGLLGYAIVESQVTVMMSLSTVSLSHSGR